MSALPLRARRRSRHRVLARARACLPLSLMAYVAWAAANAQTAAPADATQPDTTLAPVVVSAQVAPRASSLNPNLHASGSTFTADQFDNWSVTSAKDVFKYAPNLSVRKRFIGDLNSTIAGRGTSN